MFYQRRRGPTPRQAQVFDTRRRSACAIKQTVFWALVKVFIAPEYVCIWDKESSLNLVRFALNLRRSYSISGIYGFAKKQTYIVR